MGKMNYRLLLLVFILATLLCCPVSAKQRAVMLTDHSLSMAVGEKIKLSIPGTKQSDIQWTISNKKLCKISDKGVLSAKKKGKATITAKYNDATFKIKVSIYPRYGLFNEKIAEDENVIVYLHSIRNGQIYIKVVNKTDMDLWIAERQYDYHGEIYDEYSTIDDMPKKTWCCFKVSFQTPGTFDDKVKYTYTGGTFDCVMHYRHDYTIDGCNYSDSYAIPFKFKK